MPVISHSTGKGNADHDRATLSSQSQVLLAGMAHLARFLDKICLRHAGLIQEYNYITVGFDKFLLDFLHIKGEDMG